MKVPFLFFLLSSKFTGYLSVHHSIIICFFILYLASCFFCVFLAAALYYILKADFVVVMTTKIE